MSTKRTRISPRIRLRENDANAGQRPASIEDGRAKKPSSGGAIGFSSPFSDERTIFFKTENNILFPAMLPSGSYLVDTTGIVATGRMTPGASDIHWNLTDQTLLPYVDTKAILSSSFYLDPVDGLDVSFGGPLSSRMSIEIDISIPSEKFIYRCPKRHIDADPTEFSVEGTGFCYYNFVNKSWDDVGNVDLGSGVSLKTDQAAVAQPKETSPKYAPVDNSVVTSSVYYTGQFIPPNHYNQRGSGDTTQPNKAQIFAMGGKKIGTPTATFLAPGASKYHADASHVIRMSDFISTPFLLEKIKVDLPIVARRTHASSSYYNPNLNSYAANDLHCRDMDNYVVFLYRQVRNAQPIALQRGVLKRDSTADVSGSDRFLIASASMCFYNSPTTNRGLFGNNIVSSLSDFPFHSPAFKYDFNLPTTPGLTSNPPLQKVFYSGSVTLEMVPSIYASGLAGSSYLPSTMSNSESVIDISARGGWRINYVQHSWPGTAGSVAMGNGTIAGYVDYSGKTKDNFASTIPIKFDTYTLTSSLSLLTSSYTTILNTTEYQWNPIFLNLTRTGINFFKDTLRPMSLLNPDPRSIKGVFGPSPIRGAAGLLSDYKPGAAAGTGAPQFIGGAAGITDVSTRTSPVILYPHDEIILGIDAGISPFMRDSSSITGSFLKISSKNATLTLYGSQVVNDERRQHLSDWQSTSNAVHMYDAGGPVLDEHLLDPLQATTRNYHAPLLTGSFPNRSIQALSGSATNKKFESSIGLYEDWWNYPRQVVLTDDRSTPIDSGIFNRFVFRNDKFGHPAHMLQSAASLASKVSRETVLPGSKKGGTSIETYPVTNVFTGSSSYTGNTSLHATSSMPFFDS